MKHGMRKILIAISAILLFSAVFSVSASAILWREDGYTYSDEYMSGKYYKNRMSVEPTGDMRTDVIAIALSQIGYHEGNSRADMHGLNTKGNGNYVEFNRLSGIFNAASDYGYAWCAAFVNWSLYEAGIPAELTGGEIGCERWIKQFFSNDRVAETDIYKHSIGYNSKSTYTPKTGDVIFFRNIGSQSTSTHVGLVRYSDGKRVYTVEGNTSSAYMDANGGQVCIKDYAIDDPYIVGFGTPKYTEKEDVPKVDYSGRTLTTGLYIATGRISVRGAIDSNGKAVGSIENYTTFKVSNINGDWYYISGVNADGEAVEGWARIEGKCYQLTCDGKKTYKISYASSDDDMSSLPTEQIKVEGASTNISTKTVFKEHCEFLGWADTEGAEEAQYAPGGEYSADADITLYPVFKKIIVTVKFILPDGTLIEEIKGEHGDKLTAPEVPTEPGYRHSGWNAEIPDTFEKDATYTATLEEDPDYVPETETEPWKKANGCGSSLSMCAILTIALCPLALVIKRKRK